MAHLVLPADNEGSTFGPKPPRNKFILCFDGTGNKFLGNAGDSNSKALTASARSALTSRSLKDLLDAG